MIAFTLRVFFRFYQALIVNHYDILQHVTHFSVCWCLALLLSLLDYRREEKKVLYIVNSFNTAQRFAKTRYGDWNVSLARFAVPCDILTPTIVFYLLKRSLRSSIVSRSLIRFSCTRLCARVPRRSTEIWKTIPTTTNIHKHHDGTVFVRKKMCESNSWWNYPSKLRLIVPLVILTLILHRAKLVDACLSLFDVLRLIHFQ